MINVQPIKDDWINQRCKPSVIPFAGLINAPEGTSVTDFTKENFDYCTQNIVKGVTGNAVQPLTFATSMLNELLVSDPMRFFQPNGEQIEGLFETGPTAEGNGPFNGDFKFAAGDILEVRVRMTFTSDIQRVSVDSGVGDVKLKNGDKFMVRLQINVVA